MSETQREPPQVVTVIDAVDVDLVAAFWAEALHYRRVDRLDQYVVLMPQPDHIGPMFLVQGVAEAKTAKNRMHLDLHVVDPEREAVRLVSLGANLTGRGSLGDNVQRICMHDPEGNEFDIGLSG